jgi:hypothetical protein
MLNIDNDKLRKQNEQVESRKEIGGLELIITELREENLKLATSKSKIEEFSKSFEQNLKGLKMRLIEQLQNQMNYFSNSDSGANGSTGESTKYGKVVLPTEKSDSEDFIKTFEKLWKDREEILNDNQSKITVDELKNYEDKVRKLLGNLLHFNNLRLFILVNFQA